ncbi:MAG: class I SAM-dependent rRNA methyltransferase [Calditrichaeota bacterium]|nr:class I SAM-dependent rRNA methyltransferase [Calditrichota bacterium]MCB9366516.1 class I SAM-dependent rRNA methyltransferase [Calditrichota bacterium]MCB9391226.1 class I SAM-dependent rRNA methyltransferase [Calditrichota bacterium]
MSLADYPTVVLKRSAQSRVYGGHLWIFANELHDGFQEHEPGTLVRITDEQQRSYGVGTLNKHSLIAVRVLSRQDVEVNREFIFGRLDAAHEFRRRVLRDSRNCRLVFSEADGLPGLIVDRFSDLVVYQSLTAGMDRLTDDVVEWLNDRLSPSIIVAANDSSMRQLEKLPSERVLRRGVLEGAHVFEQDELRLICDPIGGQKTGYFLDQRLNRKLIQQFIRGDETFLDLFCYSGAFGAYSLQAGVKSATFVDGSERALELSRQVCSLNGFADRASFVKADVFDWVKDSSEQYDIVSVDPPALTKNRSKATAALRAYRDLNSRCMKLVRPGGLLLTSSCSGLISRVNWRRALEEAAFKSRRKVRFLAFGSQAPDHPVLAAMPETEYLKFAIAQVL